MGGLLFHSISIFVLINWFFFFVTVLSGISLVKMKRVTSCAFAFAFVCQIVFDRCCHLLEFFLVSLQSGWISTDSLCLPKHGRSPWLVSAWCLGARVFNDKINQTVNRSLVWWLVLWDTLISNNESNCYAVDVEEWPQAVMSEDQYPTVLHSTSVLCPHLPLTSSPLIHSSSHSSSSSSKDKNGAEGLVEFVSNLLFNLHINRRP